MRNLLVIILISLLPFQTIKAQISIDSIKTAEEVSSIFGSKEINSSIAYYQDILTAPDSVTEMVKHFCFLQMGTLHYYVRDYERSRFYLNKVDSKTLKQSKANFNILSRTYKLSTDLNFISGRYKETILTADTAILYQVSFSNPDSLLLCDLYYLKASSLTTLQEHDKSIIYFNKSLTYLSNNSSNQNWRRANAVKSIGSSYQRMKNYRLALKYFYESLTIYNPENPNVNLAATYYYIGSINSSLGDYNLAKKNLKKTIEIYDKIYQGKHSNYSYYYNSLASAYKNLAEMDSALLYYHKSSQLSIKYNQKTIYSSYLNLASLYITNKDYYNTEIYLKKSIESINKAYGLMSKARGEVYQFAAKYYLEINNLEKGYKFLNAAFKIAHNKENERATDLAECNKVLSTYYLKKGEYINAFNTSQKALMAISTQFKDSDLLSNPSHLDGISKKNLYSYLLWKASLVTSSINNNNNEVDLLQRLHIQKNALLAAVDVSNSMRLSLLSQEGKYWLSANNKEVYHLLIKNAIELYSYTHDKEHLASAFEASERSKSGILLDLMKDAKLKDLDHLPDSIIIKEKLLNDEKTSIEFEIYKESYFSDNSRIINRLYNELFRTKRQIEALTTFTNQNFKSFNQAKFKLDQLPIDLVQNQLNENQIILEYYLFKKNLYSISVTKYNIDIKEIDIDESFFKNLELVNNYVQSPNFKESNTNFTQFKQSSKQLYSILIKPFAEQIKEKELIIIPDDILLNLPFEILISDQNKSSLNVPNYLILSYPIHYTYSSSLLNLKASRSFLKKDTVLTFAPEYNYEDFKDPKQEQILANLPNTIKEVDQIGTIFDTKSFKSKDANKENFLKNVNDFSIVHLAMHTQIDDKNPSFSKLVFTPTPEEEYNFYTKEIYDLKLKANLIVLSACNTGAGKIRKGEGIMSFARAFLFAGCPALTLTLWTVNDKTSSVLMGNYYKYLSEGLSKSKALQQAKLEYLKNADPLKSHPYYWAAYIHIGNNQALIKKPSLKLVTISLLILSLSIAIYFGIKFRNTKKGE